MNGGGWGGYTYVRIFLTATHTPTSQRCGQSFMRRRSLAAARCLDLRVDRALGITVARACV